MADSDHCVCGHPRLAHISNLCWFCVTCRSFRPSPTRGPRMTHGTPSTYTNHACRCDPCRWAWAAYARKKRRGVDTEPEPTWLEDWATSAAQL